MIEENTRKNQSPHSATMQNFSARLTESPDPERADGPFPLVYVARHGSSNRLEAFAWLVANRKPLLRQLGENGAILFRGFPFITDEDFDQAIRAFDLKNFPFEESLSNAVRRHRTERVFTANEAPPDVEIHLHHELAQTPVYPQRLFFFCEFPPNRGGQTPLCQSHRLLERLRERTPGFIDKCERLGVRYINVMPPGEDLESGQGRGWCKTLGADNRKDAENCLRSLGYGWSWLGGEMLRVCSPALPAVRTLPDGRDVFFNQLIAAWRGWNDSHNEAEKSIFFGDHSEIPDDAMQIVSDTAEELTVDLQWRSGDMVLLDNMQIMHGRRPFSGHRYVLASLAA